MTSTGVNDVIKGREETDGRGSGSDEMSNTAAMLTNNDVKEGPRHGA